MDEETGILEVAGNVVVESDRVEETVVDDQDIDEVEQVDGTGLQERAPPRLLLIPTSFDL